MGKLRRITSFVLLGQGLLLFQNCGSIDLESDLQARPPKDIRQVQYKITPGFQTFQEPEKNLNVWLDSNTGQVFGEVKYGLCSVRNSVQFSDWSKLVSLISESKVIESEYREADGQELRLQVTDIFNIDHTYHLAESDKYVKLLSQSAQLQIFLSELTSRLVAGDATCTQPIEIIYEYSSYDLAPSRTNRVMSLSLVPITRKSLLILKYFPETLSTVGLFQSRNCRPPELEYPGGLEPILAAIQVAPKGVSVNDQFGLDQVVVQVKDLIGNRKSYYLTDPGRSGSVVIQDGQNLQKTIDRTISEIKALAGPTICPQ